MKVALVGAGLNNAPLPFGDPAWRIAGLNDVYLLYAREREGGVDIPAFTEWWELHGDTPLTRDRRPPEHFDRIKAMRIPVYYLHGQPPTPDAIRLDTDALARYGGRDYFTCTFAYQIVKAMMDGATEIAMYGTPLAANREIVVERPCVEYWLGRAEERGIAVSVYHTVPGGLLNHPYRYAVDDEQERLWSRDLVIRATRSMEQWLPREARRLGVPGEMMEVTL